MSPIADDFRRGMVAVYAVAAEHGYRATYFMRMVDEHGGVEAAKRLLACETIQSGLMSLWDLHLLGHSMEALVLQERFRELFTDIQLREARRRLEELHYFK